MSEASWSHDVDFKVPVLDGNFAPEEEGESHVARSMTTLSREERDCVLNDLHGVSSEIEETPEFLNKKLQFLEEELQKLKVSEAALALAWTRNQTYVNSTKLRLQFLRCESFAAKEAAARMARHFSKKLELFGEDKLTKDIIQDDLDEGTMEYLYSGRFQNLQLRDKSGRHVSLYITKLNSYSPTKDISVMRRIFYSSMVNMESVETQRKGMVVVFWAIGSNNSGARISASTYWKAARVQRCVPVKLVGFHFCYDTIFIRPIVSTIQLGVDFFSGIRLRSHFGNHSECIAALLSFGIPANLIPVHVDGSVSNKEQHVQQTEKRRRQERQACEVADVMVPGSFDILVGKGRPFQDHPGNIRLREWIKQHQSSYEKAQKYEKKKLVQNVIEMVRSKGGRFLKDDGGHWIQVQGTVALAKVGHLFRDKKGRRDPKAAAAIKQAKAVVDEKAVWS